MLAKIYLTKLLLRRGYDRQAIGSLYRFIDWLMQLSPVLEFEYHQGVRRYEEEEGLVGYITTAERIGEERGERKGEVKALRALIGIALDFNYGPDSEPLLAWISRIEDPDRLTEFYTKLLRGASEEELRAFCTID